MGAAIAIAIGVWWHANTVSHLFIHRPFFRRRAANECCAALLTAVLGFPQSVWRDRHLAHHRGAPYRFRLTSEIALQIAVVASMWAAMAFSAPAFLAATYLPGYLGGLALCAIHGHYEHAGGTTSHYGRLYNALCFNDGYHVEHHRHPSAPWWTLPRYRDEASSTSAWPAPLRWLEDKAYRVRALAALERLVLWSPVLQRWVVRSHARAFESVLAEHVSVRRIAIVGGGLFPRTALILRRLRPDARLMIVDASETHLNLARAFLQDDSIQFVHAHFNLHSRHPSKDLQGSCGEARRSACAGAPELCNLHCDVLVIPLSFDGDRTALYARRGAEAVIVHDWIWRKHGTSRIVSPLLLKRINLVRA